MSIKNCLLGLVSIVVLFFVFPLRGQDTSYVTQFNDEIASHRNRVEQKIEDLEWELSGRDKDPWLNLQLSLLYLNIGENKKSSRHLFKANIYMKDCLPCKEHYLKRYWTLGQTKDAEYYKERIEEVNRNNTLVRLYRINERIKVDTLKNLAYLDAFLKEFPKSKEGHRLKIKIDFDLNRLELKELESFLALDSSNYEAYVFLSDYYLMAHKLLEAKEMVDLGIQKSEVITPLLRRRAELLYKLRLFDESLFHINYCLKLNPYDFEFIGLEFMILYEKGDRDQICSKIQRFDSLMGYFSFKVEELPANLSFISHLRSEICADNYHTALIDVGLLYLNQSELFDERVEEVDQKYPGGAIINYFKLLRAMDQMQYAESIKYAETLVKRKDQIDEELNEELAKMIGNPNMYQAKLILWRLAYLLGAYNALMIGENDKVLTFYKGYKEAFIFDESYETALLMDFTKVQALFNSQQYVEAKTLLNLLLRKDPKNSAYNALAVLMDFNKSFQRPIKVWVVDSEQSIKVDFEQDQLLNNQELELKNLVKKCDILLNDFEGNFYVYYIRYLIRSLLKDPKAEEDLDRFKELNGLILEITVKEGAQ